LIEKIAITGMGSVSPLGDNQTDIWKNYLLDNHLLVEKNFNGLNAVVSPLSKDIESKTNELKQSSKHYKKLDKTVLMSILASREATKQANWNNESFGVNISSSRGATQLFEEFYDDFTQNKNHKSHPLSSPSTTLGNISSWVSQDLGNDGLSISHSITCSSALHSFLNGIAWINSGMANKFLVGGSEAPLTKFTIAQMKALKIYTNDFDTFPCKSLDASKIKNTMCLGEGATSFCLEKDSSSALAYIEGVGFATEKLTHGTSISDNGEAIEKSMKMALKNTSLNEVDVIITHTPGTLKGDNAELTAIKNVFKKDTPALTTNKWKIGHTLGASGGFSIEMAILMLLNKPFISVPFLDEKSPKKIKKILVNAIGFGGNAVSILISK
jgi:3-oxoacyl-(acyl-carrier-protein) synthase